jgi:hypothetical protein
MRINPVVPKAKGEAANQAHAQSHDKKIHKCVGNNEWGQGLKLTRGTALQVWHAERHVGDDARRASGGSCGEGARHAACQ